jgi:hypothetical protein
MKSDNISETETSKLDAAQVHSFIFAVIKNANINGC